MVFTTSDPLQRSVTLKSGTWTHKIANTSGENDNKEHGNSHEDMRPLLQEIKTTIENPLFIVKDTQITGLDENGEEIIVESKNREEYFRVYLNTEKACMNMIKVVVEFDQPHQNGEIVTSHQLNGKLSKNKIKGGVVYDASKK